MDLVLHSRSKIVEARVDSSVIPGVTMSSGTALRRHSAGVARSGNNERKVVVVPHYLRASTGSCHDICKYGRMDAEEAKEKLSMIKRAGRKALSRISEDSIGGITISVAKPKASLDSKPTKMSNVKNSESVNSVLQISDASDTNKVEIPSKSSEIQKQTGNKVLANTGKASSVRVKSSFSLSLEVEIPSKPTSKRVESSPAATSERVKTHPKLTSQMVKDSSKSMSTMKQASSEVSSFEDKEMQLSKKHATSMKTISSSEGLGGQRISKVKLKKRATSPKSSSRGIGSLSARKHKGLKIVPRFMNQPAMEVEPEKHNKEAQEKTLYVIKMESANQSSQSDQNESQEIESSLSDLSSSPNFSPSSISQTSPQEDQKESDYANTESEEDVFPQNHELEYHQASVDTLETEENGRPLKDVEVVFSEDEDCQKLNGELAETQIDKDNLQSLKRDNATDSKAAAITGPEKVVLRRQDVKDKKDGEGLYNNVIEETTRKLVETRKGKVKALIHAFETIISLEEKRTFGNILN